jgi:hypothetical protein
VRYADLTLVPDGDGYIVGSPHSPDFVAVPEIGGRVIRWLQDGLGPDECAGRAAQLAGEPVDVAGFVAELAAAGVLASTVPPRAGPATERRPPRGHRLGSVLFGRWGLAAQAALALAGAAVLWTRPSLRPAYHDAIVTDVPLASILIMTVIGVGGGLLHELAHVLAAAAKGVRSSISMGRRLYSIVYQTDLTRLWSLPRRDRLLPLAAGMTSDAATTGALLLLCAGPLRTADPLLLDLVQAMIFVKFTAILFQAEVFMRTDLYAILAVTTGCRNLWASKGAVGRRLLGRATDADLDHLGTVSRTEIRWAKAYLALYVPGVAWATWYFVAFAVPALVKLLQMSVAAVADNGPFSVAGVAGAVAAALTVVPTGLVLIGAARSGARVAAGVLRPRDRRLRSAV